MGNEMSFGRYSLRKRKTEGPSGPCYVADVPDEILEAIFVHIDPNELLSKVQYVCKAWHRVISKPSIWRTLSIRAGMCDPASLHGVDDFRSYYFLYSNNLIKNGWASDDKLKHWSPKEDGDGWSRGNGFKKEVCFPEAIGCKPLPPEAVAEYDLERSMTFKAERTKTKEIKCWATTYYLGEKQQLVDLVKVVSAFASVSPEHRPTIMVSAWTAARSDCASVYTFKPALLDKNGKILQQDEQSVERVQWEDGRWEKVWHEFTDIPAETRYVRFLHSGVDRQFWAGHYGSKFTGATVKFVFKPKS